MRFLVVLTTIVFIACAGQAIAGGPSTGVLIFTAPDGSKRIVNIPSHPGGTASIPQGARNLKDAYWSVVQDAAKTHGIDPNLVDLVIRMESGYNPRAQSPKGARGVMQLMPGTARMYGVRNAFDPFENIRAGVHYLRDLLERFDSNVQFALAAYNAGPEAVEKYRGIPPYRETSRYVSSILSAYQGSTGTKLTGGFGKPAKIARPVAIVAASGETFLSNTPRSGEKPIARTLSLR